LRGREGADVVEDTGRKALKGEEIKRDTEATY
jgi:hypothetical protein